ncbi:hypothetical protein [Streptomyces sp. GMR22]|uniref:hypothetical protein n=1 Tax=Streptomyces sp. GMR22 TaxID=2759524 RepID=UPI0015FABABF|nr:hypothetical protein [Streptomyces sp. GMR22]MBA6440793.1 hypothetical protein [Streptomyces sp. GMR22]
MNDVAGGSLQPAVAGWSGRRKRRKSASGDIVTILASGAAVDPDIAVALLSAGVHDNLGADAGCSYDDYEAWLKQTLAVAVLGE